MSRKIDARELLAALGGLLVLISLFLDWFEVRGLTITGWRAFEALDLVLAALAIAAIATCAAALGAAAALNARALLPLGLALVLIVGIQLISPPPVAWDADPSTGAWMALAGALLVLIGGALSAARIDITVNVGARDTRRRVSAVDRRPTAEPKPDPAETPGRTATPGDEPPARRSLLDEPDPDATQPFKPVDPDS